MRRRSTIRAARFHGQKNITIDEIPEPGLRPGAVEIEVAWCGICGSDLHEYLEGPIFIPPPGRPHPLSGEELPVTMGHEFSGTVSALGEGVTDLTVGEGVVVEPYFTCGECDMCRADKYHLCRSMGFIGLSGGGGGLSEKVVVDRRRVHPVGDVPLDQAALIEPLSVGHHAYVRSGARAGDVAFECSSVNAVLDALVDAVKPGGVVVNVSIWGKRATIDMMKIVLKEIDLRGTITYVNDHAEVIRLVQEGKIDLAPFITARIDLADLVDEGLDTLINRNDTAVKILVHP